MGSSDPRQAAFLQLPLAPSNESTTTPHTSLSNSNHEHSSLKNHSTNEEQPLDLTVPNRIEPRCSDCKELRREVREVKNSVQLLIQQFSDFTGRIAPKLSVGEAETPQAPQRTSPVSSVSSTESSGLKDEGKRDISPESASSSLGSRGIGKKRKTGSSTSRKPKNLESAYPSPNESALPSLRMKDISDTPIIPELKRPKIEPGSSSAVSMACPIPTYQPVNPVQIQHSPHSMALHGSAAAGVQSNSWSPHVHPSLMYSGWNNSLLRQAYESPELRRQMEVSGALKPTVNNNGIVGIVGSPSPPCNNGGVPSPGSSSGLSQAQLEAVIKNVVAMQQHKRDIQAQKYHQQIAATAKDEVPLAANTSSMNRTPWDQGRSPNAPESSHMDALAQQLTIKKRPGPDDFIKEFVEQEAFLSDDSERNYQIPVPEALECDPNFRPVSEEALLCSTRWEELDWQEAVTRLSKKLAEKRVFGPQLMAKATVAGTNHSNYPNLPIQGIMYIESVCRRVLFPALKRREFAEFFRPAVKGLAARCRRIRHSMKPGGGGDPAGEDLYSPGDEEPSGSSASANHERLVSPVVENVQSRR